MTDLEHATAIRNAAKALVEATAVARRDGLSVDFDEDFSSRLDNTRAGAINLPTNEIRITRSL